MRKIKLRYYTDEPNFGDELSIFIARELHDAVTGAITTRCNAVFIGSLLHCFYTEKYRYTHLAYLLSPRVTVWGAGFIEKPDLTRKKLLRRLDVRACRGSFTLASLKGSRFARVAENVVLADPGILAGRMIDVSGTAKRYTLGIVPHYADKGSALLANIKVGNSTVIDVQQEPEVFMRELSECENVISSSLHGLIAADSLNIPNTRMVLSGDISGGDYKFNDYYSAFGIDTHEKIILAQREFTDADLPVIKTSYRIDPGKVSKMQDALLAVFPYA